MPNRHRRLVLCIGHNERGDLVNVYSFRSSFDKKGENTHKFVFAATVDDWLERLRHALNIGGEFEVEWSPDDTEEGTLIGGLMSGFIGKRDVFLLLERFMVPNRGVASLVGIGGDHVMVSPVNFMELPTQDQSIPHMFLNIPQRDFCLVTELFHQEWLSRGFTGATFKEVGEMEDRLFVAVGA